MKKRLLNYILFTLPASWVSKENPCSDYVRRALEECLGECLGRCSWRFDMSYLCTSEQFGDFVAALMRSELQTHVGEALDLRKLNGRQVPYIKTTKAVKEDYYSE